jgi:hypothetical protein
MLGFLEKVLNLKEGRGGEKIHVFYEFYEKGSQEGRMQIFNLI